MKIVETDGFKVIAGFFFYCYTFRAKRALKSLFLTFMEDKYDPQKIEKRWQEIWEKDQSLYVADDNSDKEKFYCLDMFPYPSGDGLHVGHVESYTATDIISRYQRMRGKNVLHPQGWDAFGLPAENYAIKTKTHPSITTKKAIENFKKQIKMLGFSYDWSREVNSSDQEYYRWTQWFFLLLYKNGLAYKKKAKVNWCPKCQTVLANEQAEGGKCERCETEVAQKDLEQWFFKITDFAEELLSGLDDLDWPESTKAAQRNWIGKSEGTEFGMEIKNSDEKIEVYTTRIDTVFGMTYAVVAPENPVIERIKDKIKNYGEIEKYISDARRKTELERTALQKEKTGAELQGIKVINPFTAEEIPVFVADYVLGHYGTGAVMAVPAHDERDFEFAKKYDLPIRQSIALLIKDTGIDKPIETEEKSIRKIVNCIIKHHEKDEYICLDWKEFGWHSFVMGGVEEEESGEDAAMREAVEETGYQNIRVIKKIDGEVHTNFNARHKKIGNRYTKSECYLLELENDGRKETEEEHTQFHNFKWLKKEEIGKYLNLAQQSYYWDVYLNGEKTFADDGVLVNSEKYSGLTSEQAREEMAEWLEKEKIGKKKINYKLRDWLVSRQRYWGAPIPIIYCDKCGEVPDENLPVKLPTDVDFKPTGESPLKYSEEFQNVKCPKCGGKARRESDTMDTFVCSSWYYFRYADPKNEKEFASKEQIKKWLPVDLYVGGAEHTVLHLLYSRFFTKVLNKLGYIDFDEPFKKLRHQGIILAEDGNKMSKSKGNVVNPDDVVKKYGADALRLFEMFMGPLEDAKPWNTKGIVGMRRFLDRIYKYEEIRISEKGNSYENWEKDKTDQALKNNLNKTIKKIGEDIESLKFNTAISSMMTFLNVIYETNNISKSVDMESNVSTVINSNDFMKFIQLLAPFAPHIAEEIWNKLGHKESIFKEKWPEYDPALIVDEEIELVIQINGKLRDRIKVAADISEEDAKKLALESEKVKNFIGDKNIKKMIFVKGKLINIVI